VNKCEFLAQLRNKLRNLPADEIASAVAYYEEYFDDAGEQNEQQVIVELGSPAEVASKIIGEFAIKNIDAGNGTTKSGLGVLWIVILGIFASPVALPLALAAVIIVVALVVVIFSLLFALAVTAIALVIGGLALLVESVIFLFSDFTLAIFYIGIALIMGAVGLMLFIPIGYLSKTAVTGIARGVAKILKRGK